MNIHPVQPEGLRSRVLGCLLGGALGDAWGGPFEGRTGPLHFEIPQVPSLSDDTQLTLATCQSILQTGHISPENIASHFVRWYRDGQIYGMGSSTLKALRDLNNGTHWALAGARGEYAAGNGVAMRVAPLAFLIDPSDSQAQVLIRDVCRITHHSDEAYAGGLAVMLAIRAVLADRWSSERTFLECVVSQLPDSNVRDRIDQILALGVSAQEIARRFGATGYVVDSVPLALHCAQDIAKKPLCSVLKQTISIGGDTDTIASIAGQIAGTVIGWNGLPHERIGQLAESEPLCAIANEFAEFIDANASPPTISPQKPG